MKIAITCGYFNPLHGGHLDLIEAARAKGSKLIVIINNDKQQVLKKGKIILDEQNRMRLISSLRDVDEVLLSIDEDPYQPLSLRKVRQMYPDDELIFCKGGDRNPDKHALPDSELLACEECNIEIVYGIGSHEVEKRDSSSRINQETGHEVA